jgi:hypothetical protein
VYSREQRPVLRQRSVVLAVGVRESDVREGLGIKWGVVGLVGVER